MDLAVLTVIKMLRNRTREYDLGPNERLRFQFRIEDNVSFEMIDWNGVPVIDSEDAIYKDCTKEFDVKLTKFWSKL